MFSVGAAEIGLIAVLAIVILGPKRLPVAARWVGRMLKTAKGVTSTVKRELEQTVEETKTTHDPHASKSQDTESASK